MKPSVKNVKKPIRREWRISYPVDMFYQSLLNDKAVDPKFRKDVRGMRKIYNC